MIVSAIGLLHFCPECLKTAKKHLICDVKFFCKRWSQFKSFISLNCVQTISNHETNSIEPWEDRESQSMTSGSFRRVMDTTKSPTHHLSPAGNGLLSQVICLSLTLQRTATIQRSETWTISKKYASHGSGEHYYLRSVLESHCNRWLSFFVTGIFPRFSFGTSEPLLRVAPCG